MRFGYALIAPMVAITTGLILAGEHHVLKAAKAFADQPSAATLPDQSLWLIGPAAAAVWLAFQLFTDRRRSLIAGAATALFLCAMGAALPALWLSALVPAAAVVIFVRERRNGLNRWELIAGGALVFVIGYASYARFQFLLGYLQRELDPDAVTYLAIAAKAHGYGTESREPLFIWLLQFMHLVTGSDTPSTLRVSSLAVSLCTVAAVFCFTRRYIGNIAAVTAAALYAQRRTLVFTGIRGLREELIIMIFLAFAAVYVSGWGKRPNPLRYVALAVLGAVMVLIRLNSVPFIIGALVVLFAWSVWKYRPSLRRWWLIPTCIAIVYAPVIPYLMQCKKLYGDPWYMINVAPRFYGNLEFGGKNPDFPTREQLAKDAFFGPRLSMGTYLFKYHTVGEILSRSVKGAWEMYFGGHVRIWFTGDEPDSTPGPFFWLHVAGLLAMLLPGRRVITFLIFLFHAPAFFLIGTFPWDQGVNAFDYRLLTLAYTYYCIGIGAAVQTGICFASKHIQAIVEPEEAQQTDRRQQKPRDKARRRK